MRRVDALVLGAGMVGLGTALALLERGRSVALVDRREPAEETSFGNAGLIQAEAVVPYAFPRRPGVLLAALLDRRTDARLHLSALPRTARWLVAYARHSGPQAVERTARANVPILARALPEHRRLIDRAGASHLLREDGYVRLFRSPAVLAAAAREAAAVEARYGVPFALWDAERLHAEEPHLAPGPAGGIHHPSVARVDDPGDLGKAYAALFARDGGTILRGDAARLTPAGDRWVVETAEGPIAAGDAVIALGPWSGEAMARVGVPVPLGIKRGYHMHYRPAGNAVLNRLLVDEDHGYVITPNRRGIRLTTGAEFAPRDAPPTPVQLERAERAARALFPLGERLQDTPWFGARPCFADLLPMVGPVPGRPGLWANFGHHHLGFTLGPATGRLIAELITGTAPFTDPAPYRVDRF